MKKHGWQLPYHPLQVVAVAVFLALGFAFYVFFAPFVGNNLLQYIAIGLYTPLITCAFSLYIWCAAADPADPGVFKSKKYLKIPDSKNHVRFKESKLGGESTSSIQDANAATIGGKPLDKGVKDTDTAGEDYTAEIENKNASPCHSFCFTALMAFIPCASLCICSNQHEESCEQQLSEDGMFYCSLCEVEVFKYSKHCRVCDKCVDRFDHHCRAKGTTGSFSPSWSLPFSWFMISFHNSSSIPCQIILSPEFASDKRHARTWRPSLVLQWSTGILVIICCFLERKRYSVDIASKLGSSFTLVPFTIVVAMCTILAMIATLPLAQLFFFHVLLIKKGISTYDYIIALREQEQGIGGQQSPQMSPVSSLTGLSSASSVNAFHRGAWCTPPRLFLEDQFDVIPPDSGSVSSLGKKTVTEEPIKKKNPTAVKISPWTLARLNAEQVSKAAAEARKKSKILQPVVRSETPFGLETNGSFGSSSSRRMVPKPDNNSRRRPSKRIRLPADLTNVSAKNDLIPETSTSLAPLQLEARSAFRTSLAMSGSMAIVGSSPESSLDSPDLRHPFRAAPSGPEEARRLTGLSTAQKAIPLSRSTSDGYEASGGEDSDRVPSRAVQRSTDWSNLLFSSDWDANVVRLKAPASSNNRNI
ncbi:unnamed protein product [Camellia sinensis]